MSWVFVISFLVVLSTILLYKVFKSRRPSIVGPNALQQIMDLLLLGVRGFLTERMLINLRKFPKIFPLNSFMIPSVYVVTDQTIIKQITSDVKLFTNHSNILTAVQSGDRLPIQNSLFFIRDDEWFRRRKSLSSFFTGPKILSFIEIFRKQSNILCDILSEVKEDEFVNLQNKFANLTVDVLGEAVFSLEFGSQRDPLNSYAKTFENILTGFAGSTYVTLLPFWYHYPIKWIQDISSSINRVSNLCRTIVKNRKNENNDQTDDLLQALIDLKLDLEDGLISEVFLFMIAGHETTSNLLSWCIYEISKNPEIESKLREEINKVVGRDGEVTVDNIEYLEYTNCVIQETLRTCPPVLITDRQCNEQVTLGGHIFPKNSIFVIPVWALNHDEQLWPDPYKFDPTRFDASNKKNIPSCVFLPFGSGPRICIGSKFALHEAKVTLVKLFQKFTFEIDHNKCKSANAGVLGRPQNLLSKIKKIT